jgi:3-oxoacyl-[acyl-carrier-protein] synthase II
VNGRGVAVTGVGVIAPGGLDIGTFWDSLLAGRSFAHRLEVMEDPMFGPVRVACEVDEAFEPKRHLTHPETRRTDRTSQLGICAAMDAVADAGWEDTGGDRTAIVVGTGLGGMIRPFLTALEVGREKGFMRVNPLTVPMIMPNATAGWLSMKLGVTGMSTTVAQACSSGAAAIGDAARLVATGVVDRAIAGGTEALTHPVVVAAFARMEALSSRNDEPERASRPFDRDRDGFVMGEGAGFVTLEAEDAVVARGGRVRARLTGYGATSDAFHLVAPHEEAAGAIASMRAALADAGVEPSAVAHVNAHGTSTELNDRLESLALHQVFGDAVPPVTANKGAIGHLVGAAGAVEAVAVVRSLETGLVPPTTNFEHADPEIDLDVVAGQAREVAPGPVVSNSFAFGGHNVTLVFEP